MSRLYLFRTIFLFFFESEGLIRKILQQKEIYKVAWRRGEEIGRKVCTFPRIPMYKYYSCKQAECQRPAFRNPSRSTQDNLKAANP
jgi:hypothetical protein